MTLVTLSENTADHLADRVWQQWEKTGIKSRYMTYLEVHHIAEHFLKICSEKEIDYQEFDFYTLVDSNLNYYENIAQLDEHPALGKPISEADKAYMNQIADQAEVEIKSIEVLEEEKQKLINKNKKLEKTLKDAKELYRNIQPQPTTHIPIQTTTLIQTHTLTPENPEDAPYTKAEIIEILAYLAEQNQHPITRFSKRTKEVIKKCSMKMTMKLLALI
jgi:hypothetical protein